MRSYKSMKRYGVITSYKFRVELNNFKHVSTIILEMFK